MSIRKGNSRSIFFFLCLCLMLSCQTLAHSVPSDATTNENTADIGLGQEATESLPPVENKEPAATDETTDTIGGNADWEISRILPDPDIRSDIALVMNGREPNILFTLGEGSHLVFGRYEESGWKFQNIDTNAKAFSQSMNIGSEGKAHIAYCSYSCPTMFCFCTGLLYGIWDGDGLESSTAYKGSNFSGTGAALALDAGNNPHIAFYADSSVAYTERQNNEWVFTGLGFAGVEFIVYPKIRLDAGEMPFVVYSNPNKGNELYFGTMDGNAWDMTLIGSGLLPDFAFDKNGTPHILYCDNQNTKLMHAFEEKGSWEKETIMENACFGLMAFDSMNAMHILYYDISEQKIMFASRDGEDWKQTMIFEGPMITHYYAYDPEQYAAINMVLDENDRAYVVFAEKDLYFAMEK